MNETHIQFFQVKPSNKRWEDRNCVFMNDGFNLDNVRLISPVQGYAGIQHYFFTLLLDVGYQVNAKELRYDFANRGTAVKAQRELCAAYTKTGEHELIEEVVEEVAPPIET